MRILALVLALLLSICFSLATIMESWFQSWEGNRATSSTLIGLFLGDSRRLFANHFFVKADSYFHSGYYPTIFDNGQSFEKSHLAENAGAISGANETPEVAFLTAPLDWIDRFGRNFFPSVHTHLDEGGTKGRGNKSESSSERADVREILPWLKISAELDPSRIETYTVAAYWLRTRLGKTREAEELLREGLRTNPHSFAILFELGRVYEENRKDSFHARNIWELALKNWQKTEANKKEPDNFMFEQITVRLAQLEEKDGQFEKAINYWTMAKNVSPDPRAIQERIEEAKQKLKAHFDSKTGPPARSLK